MLWCLGGGGGGLVQLSMNFVMCFFDHFGFIHVFDHFIFVGSDKVSLLSWLNPDTVDVLLMMNLINWPFEFICNFNL
jgi:hypothetical protein